MVEIPLFEVKGEDMTGKKSTLAWLGGVVAGLLLIAIGVAFIVVGANGRGEVRDNLKQELIVGTPDMKPGGIQTDLDITMPSCDVAGKTVVTGSQARCFAEYMRVHALEATEGRTYAQMGRYLDADGKDTSDEAQAAKNPQTGRPVENPLRNLWVTERALATGLDMAYFAESVGTFSIVTGALLIVIGIGLWVMVSALWGGGPLKKAPAES